ncbi:MAG: DUF3365 domain-containing protein [Gammaproteobacteria bacterium]|nr:MAG: DUF3365 domain-containing protein [Gammaproteobacteria bacterium]RKZ71389.1 MAG: DUF3365 domain-containing protein [Gammaproteobacteria bacterium]
MANVSLVSDVSANDDTLDALNAEAMVIVKKFAGTLKPQLKAALETGGPVNAIEVCSTQAPDIARKLGIESGWDIKRVSLKARNSHSAKPDAWETRVLQDFNARQVAGESAKKMTHSEITGREFRFMKAQGVEPICLSCHGEKLSPAVSEALQQHYPDDMATGYSLGQIRGAFSLSKKL